MRSAAKIVSDVTNYTSVIVNKKISPMSLLKKSKPAGLDENSALVIIITDGGIIRDKGYNRRSRLDDNFLSNACFLLTRCSAAGRWAT